VPYLDLNTFSALISMPYTFCIEVKPHNNPIPNGTYIIFPVLRTKKNYKQGR
jgi:hypothetical protein